MLKSILNYNKFLINIKSLENIIIDFNLQVCNIQWSVYFAKRGTVCAGIMRPKAPIQHS